MSNELYKQYKDNWQQYLTDGHPKGSSWRYMEQFETEYPNVAQKCFDVAGDMILEYGGGKKIKKQ